ncbi:hypothetical protein [Rhodococcus sp. ACT016]|uniref:hypothetical protein n=1 Tax=Rhodococcus sp. ACT016 TaxID=3134808 RepID=UPI003D2D8C11
MDITAPGNEARPISAPASVVRANSDLVCDGANWEQFREPEAKRRMLRPAGRGCGRFQILRPRNRGTTRLWQSG